MDERNNAAENIEESDMGYEREKEMIRQFINDDISLRTCPEIFLSVTHFLMGFFKSRGSVPVSLLEYAYKESQEKEKRGRKYA